ncbi:hypothetical protein GJV85_12185 [Sulfurimonas aquatica]|uniref:Uncharacterized protein n=1 Tax=Sulfurimonas aquatica TaxID=2672570 RepID=A0A975B2A6_9BACT|nr:hypothetical protein [Sulfurimonas aquatica]QSZ42835.1 hypothetical protein GJV85_12185 [Sulfurimonas aquatica]
MNQCKATIISDATIEKIYNVDNLSKINIDYNNCDDVTKIKHVCISLYDKNGNIINHKQKLRYKCSLDLEYIPVVREYYADKKLRGKSNSGKVAYHHIFALSVKGDGTARQIANNENELYKANSFKEIHIDATADGIIVWPRMGFEYVNPTDLDIFMTKFDMYLDEYRADIDTNLKDEILDAIEKDGIKDLDKNLFSYLKSPEQPSSYLSFSDWYEKNTPTNETLLELYKEVK